MSKTTQIEERDSAKADEPQLEVSPKFELTPTVDTRTEEQKAADAEFQKQILILRRGSKEA